MTTEHDDKNNEPPDSHDASLIGADTSMRPRLRFPNLYLDLLRRPDIWVAGILGGIGAILYAEGSGLLRKFLVERPFETTGLVLAGAGFLYIYYWVFRQAFKRRREVSFLDVDRRVSKQQSDNVERFFQLLQTQGTKTEEGVPTAHSVSAESLAAIERHLERVTMHQPEQDTFQSVHESLSRALQRRAEVADEKASILLDRGMAYTKLGIAFYFISIVAWQIVSWVAGFGTQVIYGIASCSLLFIFIEFLSAWFLRQYRHFVDTSTYLMKVKAMFDRYMLAYCTDKERLSQGGGSRATELAVVSLLNAPLEWPDFDNMKRGDVSFAKDAFGAISELSRAIGKSRNE